MKFMEFDGFFILSTLFI